MARTLSPGRVNFSVDPVTGDMAVMLPYSILTSDGPVQKNADVTAKLTKVQRQNLADIAAALLSGVKTKEAV